MSFSCNVTYNQSFYNKTNSDAIKGAVKNTINTIVIQAEEECRRECPVRTGNLRDSHYVVHEGDTAKILNTAEYANDVIYGSQSRSPNDYPQRALNNLNGEYEEVFMESLSSLGVLNG